MNIVKVIIAGLILSTAASAAEDDLDARIRDYILKNPDVIVEALEILAERQRQAELAARIEHFPQLFEDAPVLGMGPKQASMRVVEFFDYKCVPCKAIHPKLEHAVQGNPDVRIEMRHLPILTPTSERAARYALAVQNVAGNDVYRRVHARLWDHTGPMTPGFFRTLSATENLDHAQVETAMYNDAVTQRIDDNRTAAIALEILGTPAFVTPSSVSFGQTDVDTLMAGWLSQ